MLFRSGGVPPSGASPSGGLLPSNIVAPNSKVSPVSGSPAPASVAPQSPGSASPVSAPVYAPGAAPTVATATPNKIDWSQVDDETNPTYLGNMAKKYENAALASALDPETAKVYSNLAAKYRDRAAAINTTGIIKMKDGSIALMPG